MNVKVNGISASARELVEKAEEQLKYSKMNPIQIKQEIIKKKTEINKI